MRQRVTESTMRIRQPIAGRDMALSIGIKGASLTHSRSTLAAATLIALAMGSAAGCHRDASETPHPMNTPPSAETPAHQTQNDTAAPPAVTATPTDAPTPAPHAVPPAIAPPPVEYRLAGPPGVRNAAGIRVEFLANGRVTVRGADQWGHRQNFTYESATFFRNAVPVLVRSLTPAQTEALQRIADELQPAPTAAPH